MCMDDRIPERIFRDILLCKQSFRFSKKSTKTHTFDIIFQFHFNYIYIKKKEQCFNCATTEQSYLFL